MCTVTLFVGLGTGGSHVVLKETVQCEVTYELF